MRQQVAAVCYRTGTQGIEFLLVQTRSGRWIFPKGGVEAGLTQAQSAALEAFEEAGVHGRIEEMPFARYRLDKSSGKKSAHKKTSSRKTSSKTSGETVTVHLCEVSHLEAPQEAYRAPTWFSAEKAKRRLMANRDGKFGEELAGVVDRAVSRIRRLEASAGTDFQNDALRKVRFEAFENVSMPRLGTRGGTASAASGGSGHHAGQACARPRRGRVRGATKTKLRSVAIAIESRVEPWTIPRYHRW